MLKLSDSFYRLLFATLLILFCLNGQQLVFASNLVLDKNKLEATVEISSATGSSTPTNAFDLEFDMGDASEYPPEGTPFKLSIGKSCNLDILIKGGNNIAFDFTNGPSIKELKSLTITSKKVTTKSSVKGQIPSTLCAPQDSNNGGGGSIKFEKPANDPGKSIIKLTISGTDFENLPDDFKLTSNAKIYVPPTPSPPSGSNGNGSEDGSKTEEGLNSLTIGFIVFMIVIGLGLTATSIVGIVCCVKHCKKKDDEEESETITRDRKLKARGIPKIGTYY